MQRGGAKAYRRDGGYATHSLRRTKVTLLYRKSGNLRACHVLLGQTDLESTVRYIGVKVDDALELYRSREIWRQEWVKADIDSLLL